MTIEAQQTCNVPAWLKDEISESERKVAESKVMQREETLTSPCGNYTLRLIWYGSDGFTSWFEASIVRGSVNIFTFSGENQFFWHIWFELSTPYLLLPALPSSQLLIDCERQLKYLIIDADSCDSAVFHWFGAEQHPLYNNIFTIEGRYDGSPCRIKIMDFAVPHKPKCLAFVDEWYSDYLGWSSKHTLRLSRNIEVSGRDGKRIDDMSKVDLQSLSELEESTYNIDEPFEMELGYLFSIDYRSKCHNPISITLL